MIAAVAFGLFAICSLLSTVSSLERPPSPPEPPSSFLEGHLLTFMLSDCSPHDEAIYYGIRNTARAVVMAKYRTDKLKSALEQDDAHVNGPRGTHDGKTVSAFMTFMTMFGVTPTHAPDGEHTMLARVSIIQSELENLQEGFLDYENQANVVCGENFLQRVPADRTYFDTRPRQWGGRVTFSGSPDCRHLPETIKSWSKSYVGIKTELIVLCPALTDFASRNVFNNYISSRAAPYLTGTNLDSFIRDSFGHEILLHLEDSQVLNITRRPEQKPAINFTLRDSLRLAINQPETALRNTGNLAYYIWALGYEQNDWSNGGTSAPIPPDTPGRLRVRLWSPTTRRWGP